MLMSRSSSLFRFFVGVLLAWAVLGTSPRQWATVSTARAADPPPSLPSALTGYWNLISSIEGTLFGEDKDPGVFIRIDQKITTGQYEARMGVGDKWVVNVEVHTHNDLATAGYNPVAEECTAHVVFCSITGTVGNVGLVCLALTPDDSTSTQLYPLARADAVAGVSPSIEDKFRETVRHRNSTPASVLDHTYDHARNPTSPCGLLPADQRCICVAQKAYDDCFQGAVNALAACTTLAGFGAAAVFAKCAVAAVAVPGFNIMALGPCAIAAALFFAGAILACGVIYLNDINNCINSFFTDMEGCGWHWVWT